MEQTNDNPCSENKCSAMKNHLSLLNTFSSDSPGTFNDGGTTVVELLLCLAIISLLLGSSAFQMNGILATRRLRQQSLELQSALRFTQRLSLLTGQTCSLSVYPNAARTGTSITKTNCARREQSLSFAKGLSADARFGTLDTPKDSKALAHFLAYPEASTSAGSIQLTHRTRRCAIISSRRGAIRESC